MEINGINKEDLIFLFIDNIFVVGFIFIVFVDVKGLIKILGIFYFLLSFLLG